MKTRLNDEVDGIEMNGVRNADHPHRPPAQHSSNQLPERAEPAGYGVRPCRALPLNSLTLRGRANAVVYLYASLGVLMLTGIMAMFEMAMSFNAQQMQFRPPTDSYSGSTYQQADQDLLRLLTKKDLLLTLGNNGAPWSGTALCDQLSCRFNPVAQGLQRSSLRQMFESSPLKRYAMSTPPTLN